eukprot:m.344950 g.344950  ORF g.344950 m.344950 type:complete len:754 (-) comp25486_c0_seq1:61-2322(-)
MNQGNRKCHTLWPLSKCLVLILMVFDTAGSEENGSKNPFHFFDRVLAIAMPEKVERIERLFDSLGVKGDIIDPVRKPETLKELDEYKSLTSPGLYSSHSAGEIAIAMSHRKGLKKFLDDPNARTALIFEDDASPSGPQVNLRLQKSLEALEKNASSSWDILLLGRCWDICDEEMRVQPGADLHRIVVAKCFHAFGVTRKGASKIVDFLTNCPGTDNFTCGCAADCAPIRIQNPSVFAISPALFVQSRRLVSGSSTMFSELDKERGIEVRVSNAKRKVFGTECAKYTGPFMYSHVAPELPIKSYIEIEGLNNLMWNIKAGIDAGSPSCDALKNIAPFVDASYEDQLFGTIEQVACGIDGLISLSQKSHDKSFCKRQSCAAYVSTQLQCILTHLGYWDMLKRSSSIFLTFNIFDCCRLAKYLQMAPQYRKRSVDIIKVYENVAWARPPWCRSNPPRDWIPTAPLDLRAARNVTKLRNVALRLELRSLHGNRNLQIWNLCKCLWGRSTIEVSFSEPRNNDWTVIVPVRDPIERFLAGIETIIHTSLEDLNASPINRKLLNGNVNPKKLRNSTRWWKHVERLSELDATKDSQRWKVELTATVRAFVEDVTCQVTFPMNHLLLTQSALVKQGDEEWNILSNKNYAVSTKELLQMDIDTLRFLRLVPETISKADLSECQNHVGVDHDHVTHASSHLLTSMSSILQENPHLVTPLCIMYVQDYLLFGDAFNITQTPCESFVTFSAQQSYSRVELEEDSYE